MYIRLKALSIDAILTYLSVSVDTPGLTFQTSIDGIQSVISVIPVFGTVPPRNLANQISKPAPRTF